ncbi:DNA repair protein XRCC4-like [Dysidea avara]|uniref:DNA repair protein XRCC4-like n=1 Tax=Dysidea avara TaxID=196820 RepID=UPI00331C56CF
MDTESESPMKTLIKLETEGSCSTLYILTVYEGETLCLTASDGNQTWSSMFPCVTLQSMAKDAKLSFSSFMDQSLSALSQSMHETLTFAYSTNIDSSGDLVFAWKKHIVEENVKFQIGSVTLQQSSPTISSMLEFAVENISGLKEEISGLTKKVEILKKEKSRALEKLEQCATLKEDLESDLYGKFKLVLNDKKAKIRVLSDQAKTLAEENQHLKDRQVTMVVSAKEKDAHNNDSDATTDDEKAPTDSRDRTPSPVSKITVVEDESVDATMSSLLGGSSKEVSSPPVKRRRKREVKKPPAKPPVISRPVEKVVVKKAPTGVTRPTRSTSNASSNSSLEADDLLDKM